MEKGFYIRPQDLFANVRERARHDEMSKPRQTADESVLTGARPRRHRLAV